MHPWRYVLIGGLTLLPASNTTRQNSGKPAPENAPTQKIVYVGASQDNLPQPDAHKRAHLREFLGMLHRMPNLDVEPITPDSTSDPRASFYPEDPVLGIPEGKFRTVAANTTTGATQHGNAQQLLNTLKRDGYHVLANLGTDMDGGDVLYDAKRGLFLVGGVEGEAQLRADAFYKSTGHYAVPVTMTKPYADYGVPTPSGMVESPALFYHLDTFANTLPNGELMLYPAATDAPSLARIKQLYGGQYLPIEAEDASRYISNFVSSVDATGKGHLLLPAVSHHLPFTGHIPLRERLVQRGYVVHSPEDQGHHDPHAYALNLFDNRSDFLPQLDQFVQRVLAAGTLPDVTTLQCWASEASLELAADNNQLVLRDAQGKLCALPITPNQPLEEAACTRLTALHNALTMHARWRAGETPKETLAQLVYPTAKRETLDIIAAYDMLPYYVSPEQKEKASPYIFSGGGPECMTLEVLSGASPQQRIVGLLQHVPSETERTAARNIADAASLKIRFMPTSFQLTYGDGATQEWGYGQMFEHNVLTSPRVQAIVR